MTRCTSSRAAICAGSESDTYLPPLRSVARQSSGLTSARQILHPKGQKAQFGTCRWAVGPAGSLRAAARAAGGHAPGDELPHLFHQIRGFCTASLQHDLEIVHEGERGAQ